MSQPVVVLTITLTPATLNGCDGMACSVTADRPTTPRMIAQAASGLVDGLVRLRERVGQPSDPGLMIAHEALLVVAGIGDTHLRSMKDPLGRPG